MIPYSASRLPEQLIVRAGYSQPARAGNFTVQQNMGARPRQ
jgi:hypothetical protein